MRKRTMIKNTVKKHIPQKYMTEVRILYRLLMETVSGIKRTGIMNIAIIAAMAAILTIFGALFRTTFTLNSLVDKMGDSLEISVYVSQNGDTDLISKRIRKLESVEDITLIPKEQAWQDMKKDIDLADMKNPLPDTLHVKVDTTSNIPAVCDEIKKIPGVQDLNYASDIADKIQTFTHVFNTVTILVVFIVAILTIVIINSTIQLVIQSRKDEIEIMRLMGVSNWYIKIPLILQGATYGFVGALLSLVPLNTLQKALAKMHDFFMVPPPEFALNLVVLSMFVIAVFFSAGGSMLSIKKHLQV